MEKDKAETEGDETCVQCTHTKVRHTEYSPASPLMKALTRQGCRKWPRLPSSLPRSQQPRAPDRRLSERGREDGVSGVEWSGWGVIKGAIMALSKRPPNNNDGDDRNTSPPSASAPSASAHFNNMLSGDADRHQSRDHIIGIRLLSEDDRDCNAHA